MTDERVRRVVERVAQGVWRETTAFEQVFRQCVFCCVAPGCDHDETCPVREAQAVTNEEGWSNG
jgi:hypothetical protein